MLPVTERTIRVFVHVAAATVWVGGQFVLAGLVPVLRRDAPEAIRGTARRFQVLAWPAYGVLIVTGVVNLLAVNLSNRSSEYIATLAVKLVAVALSGVFAAAHAIYGGRRVAQASGPEAVRRRRAISGILGAGSALSAAAALFLGVLLA